jgi:deoxyribodipyrimidine photo-lyase
MSTALWWIRRDLRLMDNPALQAALTGGQAVIPVFILDPLLLEKPAPKRTAFLFSGLRRLDADLRKRGSRLIVRTGRPSDVLARLFAESGAQVLYAGEDYSPYARRRDAEVARHLPIHLVLDSTIQHPVWVVKPDGSPYTVFTPFRKAWKALPLPSPGLGPPPERFPEVPQLTSENLPESAQLPGFPAGEAEGQRRIDAFLSGPLFRYAEDRNRLDLEGTSALSPYLRFGMVSALHAARAVTEVGASSLEEPVRQGAEAWLNELIWRDFYAAILYHFPSVLKTAFNPGLRQIVWRDASADLEAWQDGRTGYPVLDACLRQLNQTGWMHNRGRMIVASFLCKDLLINWQEGERWFMRQLIDGDPAANNGGWQWTAGVGTDAAPYFRIFNPVLQGKKFDPQADFIRRWVPELDGLPDALVHEPWLAPRPVPGYPPRLVEHAAVRERTLAAYRQSALSFRETG